jgi:hypothetical protein
VKRVLTSVVVFLVVFVVFALVVGQLRGKLVQLQIPFFPTVQTSAEALAYVSFFIGLSLSGIIAIAGDLALRRKFRMILLEQRKQLEAASQSTVTVGEPAEAARGEQRP